MIASADWPFHDRDEDSLFARARGGDNAAWEELFRRCYPKVIRVVRRRLNNRAMRAVFDSTDFASDVMKSLAANANRWKFESLGALIAFLEREAEWKVKDGYRKALSQRRDFSRQRHLGAIEGDGGAAVALASGGPTASQIAQASEAQERLLDGLTGTEREMIRLKYQGHSNAEIADGLGLNIRKVQRFFQELERSYHRRSDDA
jgi:RNA polymerase sigma factor (sigma-70 family)